MYAVENQQNMLQYNNNSHENNFSIKCGAISISAWKANSYILFLYIYKYTSRDFFLNEIKLNFKILYFGKKRINRSSWFLIKFAITF